VNSSKSSTLDLKISAQDVPEPKFGAAEISRVQDRSEDKGDRIKVRGDGQMKV